MAKPVNGGARTGFRRPEPATGRGSLPPSNGYRFYTRAAGELACRHRVRCMRVARAAGRAMVGPNALVGSNAVGTWYIAGGAYFYNMRLDTLYPKDLSGLDLPAYFGRFDAVAEDNAAYEGFTWNRERVTAASLYASRALGLKGFYLSAPGGPAYLLFSARVARALTGFAYDHVSGTAYRFSAQRGGGTVFVTAVCRTQDPRFAHLVPPDFSSTFELPGPSNAEAGATKVDAFLLGDATYRRLRADLAGRCTIRDSVRGSVERVSMGTLLGTLAGDRPIRFFATYPEAVRAAKGIVVEPDGRSTR